MPQTQTSAGMETVHVSMLAEFGRQAGPLDAEGIQRMRFPGGSYVLVIRQASDTTLRVFQAVGTPDFEMPGLSNFLLSEHASWIFGRLERDGDTLVVSHSLAASQLEDSLAQVVEAVHTMAVRTEAVLLRAGALSDVDATPDDFEG